MKKLRKMTIFCAIKQYTYLPTTIFHSTQFLSKSNLINYIFQRCSREFCALQKSVGLSFTHHLCFWIASSKHSGERMEWDLWIPGMHKRLPMASLMAFPVLPYFEGEDPATPPGLWVGALKDFGLTLSLMLKLLFEVPPCQRGTNVLSLQSVCRLPIFSPQTSSSPSLCLN